MKNLIKTFFGRTIEGDFETDNTHEGYENIKQLNEIRYSFDKEVRRIVSELNGKIGILNPAYKENNKNIFDFTPKFKNELEIKDLAEQTAIKNGYKKPILNQYTEEKKDIFETPDSVAIMYYGKDTAIDYTNVITKVEIYSK